jgi:hypothetical protein
MFFIVRHPHRINEPSLPITKLMAWPDSGRARHISPTILWQKIKKPKAACQPKPSQAKPSQAKPSQAKPSMSMALFKAAKNAGSLIIGGSMTD